MIRADMDGTTRIAPALCYATTSDGVRIAYLSIGDGPPVVAASNMFGDASGYCGGMPFRDVIDRIVALGWRVILHDPRGMGGSDRNVDDHSLAARVRDLAAVVGALGLERFALSGVDVGAATAVAYAVEHPNAVSRLLLTSPWASGARYLALPALRAAYSAEASDENQRRLFANIVMAVASGFQDPEMVRLGGELLLRRSSAATLAAYNAANGRIDIRDLLPRVSVPTLVTHEPSFPFGSFELCQEVAAGIPNAEFLVLRSKSIAGRHHDEAVAAVDRFLRAGTATRAANAPRVSRSSSLGVYGLTAREIQVLRRVATGASNKEIAGQLDVAVSTVERHLVNIYNKIGARGRADAIALALRSGIGEESSWPSR
jgi:pimeloyl-ACP methyl ester carboxylesterase/DNA-binding CsgD family transcriptional regulator